MEGGFIGREVMPLLVILRGCKVCRTRLRVYAWANGERRSLKVLTSGAKVEYIPTIMPCGILPLCNLLNTRNHLNGGSLIERLTACV